MRSLVLLDVARDSFINFCMLSTRLLGSCIEPNLYYLVSEHAGLGLCQECSEFCHLSWQRNKECCFNMGETGYGTFYFNSTKCNGEGEDQNIQAIFQKRKAPLGSKEYGRFCWQIGVPSNWFTGRIKGQVRRQSFML